MNTLKENILQSLPSKLLNIIFKSLCLEDVSNLASVLGWETITRSGCMKHILSKTIDEFYWKINECEKVESGLCLSLLRGYQSYMTASNDGVFTEGSGNDEAIEERHLHNKGTY